MNRQQQIDEFLLGAHQLAVIRLKERPDRVGPVLLQLQRWRQQAGTTRADRYWDDWERLLSGPLDVLIDEVCATTDHAAALRNVSPFSTLITSAERKTLMSQARQPA